MRRWLLLCPIVLAAGAVLRTSCADRSGSAAPPQRPAATIRGQVTDAAGPVNKASVGVKGTRQRVATDGLGRFLLPTSALPPGSVVASRPGYFIGGAEWRGNGLPLSIALKPHPASDCASYQWVGPAPDAERPEQCGNCHQEIYRQWAQGGHAQSAASPYFRNLYDGTDWHGNEDVGWSLLAEFPEAGGVCFSCHVPSLEPDMRAVSDLRKIGGVAREGVHCDFCHKIVDVSLTHVGLDHGRFAMRLVRPPPGRQLFFGPLDDEDRGSSVYSPLYRQSRYCASCHEGIVLGTHAYSEYSEWLASRYAREGVQCQDCHMKPTGRMTNVAPRSGGMERDPLTLASHGSGRGRPEVLRSHLDLALHAVAARGQLEVTADVKLRGVGHRMPTGYPDRSLILWVSAADADERPLELLDGPALPPLAGRGRPEQGGLAGQPGRMYAKILEGLDGRQPVPYWRPNRVACDTRLQPDQADRVRFRFKDPRGDARLLARLIYRRFSKDLAEQKGWPDNDLLIVTRQWPLP